MPILPRPHPYQKDVAVNYSDRILPVKADLYGLLKAASLVVGINSTVLLEALLLGKHVVSCGISLATGLGVFSETRGKITLSQHRARPQSDRVRRFLSELIFRRQVVVSPIMGLDDISENAVLKRLI